MSSTVDRRYVTSALKAMIVAAKVNPAPDQLQPTRIDVGKAPTGVVDQVGKLLKPHWIIYPIPGASGEASYDDEYEIVALEYQITAFGMTSDQAEWMSDKLRKVMVGKTDGELDHDLVLPVDYPVTRNIALWGGVVSDAPGTFTVQDSYMLVVS